MLYEDRRAVRNAIAGLQTLSGEVPKLQTIFIRDRINNIVAMLKRSSFIVDENQDNRGPTGDNHHHD